MNNSSIKILKIRQAARLGGLFLLVTAAATPQFAQSEKRAVSPANLVAEVDVNLVLTAPPPPREEIVVERDRPSRDHVWIKGYWAWREGRHEWVAGRWERPPQGRHEWVEPKWERRENNRGYVFTAGYWR